MSSEMEFELHNAKQILRRTPATLSSLLGELPDDWTTKNEGPDTWSAYQIVGHLIHGEKTDWIPRAKIILQFGEQRTFDPFDREAMLNASTTKPLSELLNEFAQLRRSSLQELDQLQIAPEMLERRGTHPEFGSVTLAQLLATWVAHDLGHIAQIARVMAKQYKTAVGPWTAYLPVLTR